MQIDTRDCKGCGVNYPIEIFPLADGKNNLDRNGQPYRRHLCGQDGNSCYHGHKKDLPNSKRANQKRLKEYKENARVKFVDIQKKQMIGLVHGHWNFIIIEKQKTQCRKYD